MKFQKIHLPRFDVGELYALKERLNEVSSEAEYVFIEVLNKTAKEISYNLYVNGFLIEAAKRRKIRWAKNPRTGEFEDCITLIGRGVPVFARDKCHGND